MTELSRETLETLLCVVVAYHAICRQQRPHQPRPDLEALKHTLEVSLRGKPDLRATKPTTSD